MYDAANSYRLISIVWIGKFDRLGLFTFCTILAIFGYGAFITTGNHFFDHTERFFVASIPDALSNPVGTHVRASSLMLSAVVEVPFNFFF
jgi:hypothetical protein